MANFKSDLLEYSGAPAQKKADGRLLGQCVSAAVANFTVPASGLAVNDTIELVKLPKGAVLLPSLCAFTGDFDASATVELDGFTGATAATGSVSFAATATKGKNAKLAADTVITAKVKGAAVTAGKVAQFVIAYTTM